MQEPQQLFCGPPGPENGANGVENGGVVIATAISHEQPTRQPTDQAPQPSSTNNEDIYVFGLSNHGATTAVSSVPLSPNAQNGLILSYVCPSIRRSTR